MKLIFFVVLSVLVVSALGNPASTRTTETDIELEFKRDFDYNYDYDYEYSDDDDVYVLADKPKKNVKKPKYEIVRETDISLDYEVEGKYNRDAKKTVRSK